MGFWKAFNYVKWRYDIYTIYAVDKSYIACIRERSNRNWDTSRIRYGSSPATSEIPIASDSFREECVSAIYFDPGAMRVRRSRTNSARSLEATSDTAQNWNPPCDHRMRL